MNSSWLRTRRWLMLCSAVAVISDLAMSQLEPYYDIYMMGARTGRIQQVSHVAGRGEYNPSWSPDDKYIVHDIFNPGPPFSQMLGITNVRTQETVRLRGTEGGNNAVWSPCGLMIAYDLCPGYGHGCDPRIFITTPIGFFKRLLVTDAQMPDWSPDSKRIVFSRASDGSIYTVDVTGKHERLVVSSQGYGGMVNPKWSPDGKWIAFEWYGWIEKVRVDREGKAMGNIIDVTDGTMYSYYPTWSPNMQTIAFGSSNQIWITGVTNGTPTVFVPMMNGQGVYDPAWSHDGEAIAFDAYTIPSSATPADAAEAVAAEPVAPTRFSLAGNYPNPFNPSTSIAYELPKPCRVSLIVYDALGNEVATLVNGLKPAGKWTAQLDGSRLASGVYFCRMRAEEYVATTKMILLK